MNLDRRLRIDFTWVLAGNILYSACQWLIVVVLAKLGSAEQVGEYALGLAVSAPIILFGNLQLRSLLASDVVERFSFSQYLTFRLVSLGSALAVVAAVASFTTGNAERGAIIVLVGMAQALELVSDTSYGLMQKHDRMDRVSRSLMYRGPLSLAAMWIAMYFTRSIVWALVGLTIGRLVVLVSWDMRLGFAKVNSTMQLRGNSGSLWALLRIALPLGVISMLVSLNANIPRYFVQAHLGSAELGMYSAVASLLSAGTLVVSAYGQALFLSVARACAAFDRGTYRKCAWLTVILGAILGGLAVVTSLLFGRTILTHLFRPQYGQHADVLVRLMIAGTITFVASGLGFVMTAARSLRPQIPLFLVAGGVAAVASAKWVPTSGLMGAANAVLMAAVVQLLGTCVILLCIDRRFQDNRRALRPVQSECEIAEVEAA